jgi:toxin ParE1/3/4
MVILWTTPATEELVAAHEYVASENAAAAQRITNHIWETVGVLARHPAAGRKGRVAGTRELVIPGTPFVAAYRVEKNEVWILALLHGARKWPKEF